MFCQAEPERPRKQTQKTVYSSNENDNHDYNLEPPELGASPFNTVNPSDVFMPPGQHPGLSSYLETKVKISRGSTVLRPPGNFFDKSVKPSPGKDLNTDAPVPAPQKAHRWPSGLHFKKPVKPATLTNDQATHPGLRSEFADMFLADL